MATAIPLVSKLECSDFIYEGLWQIEYNHDDHAWIPLYAPSGRWEWVDGTSFDYVNWVDIPLGATYRCTDWKDCYVAMWITPGPAPGVMGTWEGFTPDWQLPFVCSRPSNY